MAHEFVFTMQDVRKVVPPDRVILDGITLAFLPGAKHPLHEAGTLKAAIVWMGEVD